MLEARTVMSAISPTEASAIVLSPAEQAAMAARVQKLKANQFSTLQAVEVQFLTPTQIKGISSVKLWNAIPADARSAFSSEQVQQLVVSKTGIAGLTADQIESLTVSQIQSLKINDFPQLLPRQIESLTTKQVQLIKTDKLMRLIPEETRAALSGDQIQKLKIASIGLSLLTTPQIESLSVAQIQTLKPNDIAQLLPWQLKSLKPAQWKAYVGSVANSTAAPEQQVGGLTVAQIRALQPWQFEQLTPEQVPYLTPEQISSVSSNWYFKKMKTEARAAFTSGQVRAVMVGSTGIDWMTAQQVSFLSTAQIQSLTKSEFPLLSPAQVAYLSPSQIASIDNSWWFGRMSAESRAALKPAQVQALRVDVVGLKLLTPTQVQQLSTDQIRQLVYAEFQYLQSSQVPLLTSTQVGSIPNGWWFERMSTESRAALTTEQVRGLNVAVVGLGGLTTAQRAALMQPQVQSISYDQFRYLSASQAPWLTGSQLASIDNSWWFKQIPEAARAALTATQVRSLDISDIGLSGLTPAQVDALSQEQIQQVVFQDFRYLTAGQAPNLLAGQLAAIDNGWWFGQIPEATRAALTGPQVQALRVNITGIEKLTDSQIAWLTPQQIRAVGYSDFDRLHADQIDDLSVEQMASIPNSWWFQQIPEDVRIELTGEQIQALNVAQVTINDLTASQRSQLTVDQIQDVNHAWYFKFLNAEQVTHLTTDQMELFENEWQFHQLSDEAQAALSRVQILAMPEHVHAQLLDLDAGMFSPVGHVDEHDHEEEHDHQEHDHGTPTDDGLPHPDDPAKRDEHLALFNLVPREAATFVSIASGNWSDPSVWQGNTVPTGSAQVLVSAGNSLTFDVVQTSAMRWVRVDGTLEFATNLDTQMLVDTVIVDGAGTLRLGTAENPIASGVAARIVIADNGQAIDQAWDPLQLSRGVISHGTVEMHGETVTPFVSLEGVRKGVTQLTLDSVPANWRAGDRLVLTGTSPDIKSKQDEELKLIAINGNTITIDSDDDLAGNQGLKFNHLPPEGFGLKVYIADMNRNVVIMSQNPAITQRRGHVMFMHSNNVHVENVGFYGLGRTDKRNPANDPVLDDDGLVLATTGLNPRGRYAVHFHRTGIDGTKTPAFISGSAVVDSPGWGFVNHDSNVDMLDNVAFNVQGASFVSEVGSEIGSMIGNLSIRSEGSGDGLEDRQDIFDFGHGGHGFWLQGPGVEVVDNIAASNAQAAFIFFTASSQAEFSASNLDDPSLAAGRSSVPVGTVPLKRVDGNIAFASQTGLETWFHLTHMPDGQSYIENTTTWNTSGSGFFNPYTGRTTIRNATVLGRMNGSSVWGTAFGRNNVTNNMTYEDVRADGWDVGIDVPVNRATVITNGVFRAVRAININTTEDTIRTVDIIGDPQFLPLTSQQLGSRQQFEIYLNGEISLKNRDLETYFSPDIVRLGTVRFNNHQVYYFKQAAEYVPFPATATESLTWLPPEVVGKTNQQLWDEFGIAPGGVVAPSDALMVDGINGLVGSRATYQPDLELRSAKYTNQPNNYMLRYQAPTGDIVNEKSTTPIREGWNLVTRQVDGATRTFFIYGDTKAPVFVLDPRTDLRVNPKGLQFGIVIRGTVLDDSFGEMHFRREFKDLASLPIKTEASGKKYLELTFSIRDLAGNSTNVTLRVYLDSTVPIVPGTDQRDLPPREVPRTLAELLEYYFLTGQTDAVLSL